jgi:hypothetical protein
MITEAHCPCDADELLARGDEPEFLNDGGERYGNAISKGGQETGAAAAGDRGSERLDWVAV